MDFGGYVLIFEFLFFIMVIPTAVIIVKKLTEQIKTSDTIVINHQSSKTKMKAIGNLVSKTIGKSGRLHIKYLSRDSKKGEIVDVIVRPNQVKTSSRGVWSGEKAILEIFPGNAQDYISNILNEIELKNAESNIISAQKEGLNRQQMHLEEMGEGEISNVNLGLIKDYTNKLLKSGNKDEGRLNPKTYPTSRDSFTA